MAEKSQIIIFPAVRISKIAQDLEEKKRNWRHHKKAFKESINEKARPYYFLFELRKTLFSGLLASVLVRNVKKALGQTETSEWNFKNLLQAGLIIETAKPALMVAKKVAGISARFLLRKYLKPVDF